MTAESDASLLWLSEHLCPTEVIQHGVTRVLEHRQTAFQDLLIVDSGAFGRALILDGKWQSATADEFLYHESLVHPAMLAHGNPKSVLILGGGEGATAREVLRWRGVERCVMVDIDEAVVNACRKHLPQMSAGAFEDPRLDLRIGDALELLDTTRERWDVVISDLSDPIEDGPSLQLFTREYFSRVRRVLTDAGTFVVQAGSVAPVDAPVHVRLWRTVESVFGHAASYASTIPSFGYEWGFVLASERPLDHAPDPARTDAALAAGVTSVLRHVDGRGLLGMLQTHKYLRTAFDAERRVYTLDDPPKYSPNG